MDNEEESQKNQGQQDEERRKGLVDSINNAYNRAQSLRRTGQAIKGFGAASHAAEGLAGAATEGAAGSAMGAGATAAGSVATEGAAAAGGAVGGATASGTAAAGASTPVGWIAAGIAIALVLILIIIFFFNGGGGSGNMAGVGGSIPGGGTTGGGISGPGNQCTYYGRSGGLKPVEKVSSLVNEVANKVGVPSSVLLGIIRIETPAGFTYSDPSFFNNDFDATVSFAGAVGFMQFLPSTFNGVYYSNQDELKTLFGKESVSTSLDQSSDTSVLRITSIKDSIIAAAFKVRADKAAGFGSDSPWDEGAVKLVARRYQGACLYNDGRTEGDYCEDLWKSVSGCQSSSNPIAANSCPISGGVVTCGSEFTLDANGCGHCTPAYIKDWDSGGWCAKDRGIHYAMDIGAKAGQEVYLPKVNDHMIKWTLSYEEVRPDYAQAIYGYSGEDETTGDKYYIQFHHVEIGSQNAGGTHESGEIGARVCTSCNPGNYHLHMQLGAGGVGPGGTQWIDTPKYFCKS